MNVPGACHEVALQSRIALETSASLLKTEIDHEAAGHAAGQLHRDRPMGKRTPYEAFTVGRRKPGDASADRPSKPQPRT
jgi:hypothetical protein